MNFKLILASVILFVVVSADVIHYHYHFSGNNVPEGIMPNDHKHVLQRCQTDSDCKSWKYCKKPKYFWNYCRDKNLPRGAKYASTNQECRSRKGTSGICE